MPSADNLCKQFGPRSGLTKLDVILILIVWYSDDSAERLFFVEKVNFEKNQRTTKKHAK